MIDNRSLIGACRYILFSKTGMNFKYSIYSPKLSLADSLGQSETNFHVRNRKQDVQAMIAKQISLS